MEQEPYEKTHPNPHIRKTGKDAYELWRARLAGTKAGSERQAHRAGSALGPGIDDLVEFNIEAIDCRFCDDLAGFWKQVRTKVTEPEQFRPKEIIDKPPEGSGWVVEVRGYTFHHKREPFVIETLLANLARLGAQVDAAPAASGAAPGPGTPAAPAKPVREGGSPRRQGPPRYPGQSCRPLQRLDGEDHRRERVQGDRQFPARGVVTGGGGTKSSAPAGNTPAAPGSPPAAPGGTGAAAAESGPGRDSGVPS